MATNKPAANILELPLEERAEMALKEAVREVVEEHARLGLPLHLWRDGRMVEVSAQELKKESAKSE